MFKINLNRRSFLSAVGMASIPVIASAVTKGGPPLTSGGHKHQGEDKKPKPIAPAQAKDSSGYVPVVTPGIATLPYELDGDVKVFNLIAEPVVTQFQDMSDPHGARRRPIHGWGYNGSIVGPTIEAVEGDRVRIIVENRLPEPTTVHWHGLHVPIEMDGVTGISQDPIEPGQSFVYEFTLEQHGTYFYHPHFMGAKQVGLGMSGFFIIHPKNPQSHQIVDRDYAYFLQTWMIQPGSPIPDTLEMVDFNYFTMNGKPAPDIIPMQAKSGERVRIRVANLSMLTHPIHLHGHSFRISDWGAGFLPLQQQILANTTDISSAEARALEFVAGRKGKWLLHCHFMHHTMNDMHRIPIGNKGGGHAAHEMGGMHTWIEVV